MAEQNQNPGIQNSGTQNSGPAATGIPGMGGGAAPSSMPGSSASGAGVQQQPRQGFSGAQALAGSPGTRGAELPPDSHQVYTMPEKFMPAKIMKKGGKGGGKKWFLIIGLIVAALLILTAIIVYAFTISSVPQEQPAQVEAAATQDNATNEADSETNDNANENSNTAISLNLEPDKDLAENINEELAVNENTNIETNTATVTSFPDRSGVRSARDKDSDKLTDEEEELYDTKFDKPDSDNDGFIDGTEVLDGFSPSEKDKTMLQSGTVVEYENDNFDWTINYPAEWFADPLDNTGREVLFTSDAVEGELVEVIISDNELGQTAAEWYASLFSDIEEDDLDAVKISGLNGIVSPDGFTYYVADDVNIIGIVYQFGTKDEVHFETTFAMMVNSFAYTAKKKEKTGEDKEETTDGDSAATNAATNTNSTSNTNVNTNTSTGLGLNSNSNTNASTTNINVDTSDNETLGSGF